MGIESRVPVPGWGKVLWGIGVIILNALLAAGLLRYSYVLSRLDLLAAAIRIEPAQAAVFLSGAFSLAVVALVALAGSIAHLWRWSGLPRGQRLGWLAVLLLSVPPGLLLYWLVNVAREPVTSATASDG